jgi:mono/diheme cytochrome c family protein
MAATGVGLALPGVGAASAPPGNPAAGKRVWQAAQPACGICHRLQAANAYGSVGPDLDKAKPSLATSIKFITHGGVPTARYPTPMQTYGGVLTTQQIRDVAAFIFRATHT